MGFTVMCTHPVGDWGVGLRTESPLLYFYVILCNFMYFYDTHKCKEGWGIDSLFLSRWLQV